MVNKKERQQASQVIADLAQNTFFRRFWRAIGMFLGRGKPMSIWVSAAVVMSANLLSSIAISALLGETQFTSRDAIIINFMWVASSYFAIPLLLFVNTRLVEFLRLRLVDSLQDQHDVHELLAWAKYWLGRQIPQLLFSFGVGIVAALLGFYSIFPLAKFSVGQVLLYFIDYFCVGGVGIYGLLSVIGLVLKLNKLNLRLYPDDPASSPILMQLSRELRDYILFIAFIGAILMLLLGLVEALNIILIISMVIAFWIPIMTLFIMGNYAFSQQITRAKYERLEYLQSKIMELSNVEKIDKETTAHIISLMDYHDRVKGARNSLYNIRSFTNLFGSLALPFLAAALNAIDVWQKTFGMP